MARGGKGVAVMPGTPPNGCFHHDDCETCPFEDCILGTRSATNNHKPATVERIEQAKALRGTGMTLRAIGLEMGVTPGQVHRWCYPKQEGIGVEMRTRCKDCQKNVSVAKVESAKAYAPAPGAVEIKGTDEHGHPLNFITSARQYEEAGVA